MDMLMGQMLRTRAEANCGDPYDIHVNDDTVVNGHD